MNKVKPSTVIANQIPRHIREAYPQFVNFFELYYDFLNTNYNTNIEEVKDIDSMFGITDEALFNKLLTKFKFELSKDLPVHLIPDSSLVMKHLRDFYLARGSEKSFKFLFRTLFDKEVMIKRPADNMLRASDGIWVEKRAIFVKYDTYIPSINLVNGNFIKVSNTNGKLLDSIYIEDVIQYADLVYELVINSNADIDPGDKVEVINSIPDVKITGWTFGATTATVEYENVGYTIKTDDIIEIVGMESILFNRVVKVTAFSDNSFTFDGELYQSDLNAAMDNGFCKINNFKSNVLTCPTEIKVINGGSGFSVGDTFSLTTQKGKGCIIQVTSTRTKNGVKGIIVGTKITEFGLDYDTTFYSTLVKQEVTDEYQNEQPYQDEVILSPDYGWITKQTYFYHNNNIPTNGIAFSADAYYGDPSYVGETFVGQFFDVSASASNLNQPAFVEVQVGGVAKYAGYYQNNNGFISDNMFIQDNDYYQIFSYVVNVDKELSKYLNIVKALVHPTGTKMFSEYNITNTIVLDIHIPHTNFVLNLPLFESPQSVVQMGELGRTYSTFIILTDENGSPYTVPNLGGPFATAIADVPFKIVSKPVHDSVWMYENTALSVDKPLEEDPLEPVDEIALEALKILADSHNFTDSLIAEAEKGLNDTIDSDDVIISSVDKLLDDPIDSVDEIALEPTKPLTDTSTVADAIVTEANKGFDEVLAADDVYVALVDKIFDELMDSSDTYELLMDKSLEEIIDFIDEILIDKVTAIQDTMAVNDLLSSEPNKVLDDSSTITDTTSLESKPELVDSINNSTNVRLFVSLYYELTNAPYVDLYDADPYTYISQETSS